MSDRFMGAIPKTAEQVADHLDLWEVASLQKSSEPYLRRAVRHAAGSIRELIAERDKLRARVTELEGEVELATWARR